MNQSVAVSKSVTLSWKVAYTAEESNHNRQVIFKRYPQNNSSASVDIGSIIVIPGKRKTFYEDGIFEPRIAVVRSTSAISEPAFIIQHATKQDEAFYQIEVEVGTTVVASDTIFLTVFGNYVHSLFAFLNRSFFVL